MSSTIEWKTITLERMLAQGNLAEACRRVVRSKGAAGADGMEAGEPGAWCQARPRQIPASVLNGTCRPKPIRRQCMPKAPGIGEYAYSVNSCWRMARTPVINKALSNAILISEWWTWLEDTEFRLG